MEKFREYKEKDRLNTLSLYYCGYEECTPGHSFGPAVRPHYLLHFVFEGKGVYTENGREHHLTKGDTFLIKPGESTIYCADNKEPWEYAWVALDGHEAKYILGKCGLLGDKPVLSGEDWSQLKPLILALVDKFIHYDQNEYELLGYVYFIFSLMIKNGNPLEGDYISSYFIQAVEYIKNNYSYDIKISDVARYVGIDRTYLYKIFIEEEGVSPMQYLIQWRIHLACNMLSDTKMPITQIALSAGFKDVQSFCKHFKKQKNITPLQYRKLN